MNDPKNLPNAEELARALRHLVTLIREAPDDLTAHALPLEKAMGALDAWDGAPHVASVGAIVGTFRCTDCPTCGHSTVLRVA